MTAGLTAGEFDQLFQRFADSPTSTSVFRWEARQYYAIPHDEPSLVAFRESAPRPERSVRTSPWLARIATSTAAAGKTWRRVRRVSEPLSEYVRWELLAYVESQAAGEQILIVDSAAIAAYELPDYWLFDGTDQGDQYAIVMHYDEHGSPVEFEFDDNPGTLEPLRQIADDLRGHAAPLNAWLAARQGVTGAA